MAVNPNSSEKHLPVIGEVDRISTGRKSKKFSPSAVASSKDRGDSASEESSGTQFLKWNMCTGIYERVDRQCLQSSTVDEESLRRPNSVNITNRNSPTAPLSKCIVPLDSEAIVSELLFLLKDEAGRSQQKRMHDLLETLVRSTANGFCIRDLDGIVIILNYLVDNRTKQCGILPAILENASRLIGLKVSSDAHHYKNNLSHYYNFLGYLLIGLEDSEFELTLAAVREQLERGSAARSGVCPLPVRRAAAVGTTLHTTAARMLAVCSRGRFPDYLALALILASISSETCMHLVKENILENLLYRFNPYFPEKDLPEFDINPQCPQDDNVKLGESSVHLLPVLSLLLILLHNTAKGLDIDSELNKIIQPPGCNALRCWAWAFRYECRARHRHHERSTMVAVTMELLRCFGDRLPSLSIYMMPDVLSLAVQTEVPTRDGWLSDVRFNTSLADVEFKKMLIYTSVQFLRIYKINISFVESRYWMIGLMYMVDPCLYQLKNRWDEPLFAELRKAALQAMAAVIPLCPSHLAKDCGLIRRVLWYIEWYTVSPFDMSLLYWCVRLLQAASGRRGSAERDAALRDLADSHALVIIVRLCYNLLEARQPPVERAQAVLAQCLRLLTSAALQRRNVVCVVYPVIRWPDAVASLAKTMLDVVLSSLRRNLIVSPRLTIAVFNFIWENIFWKKEYRTTFISNNGIYKVLDVISMSGEAVQTAGLALVCEAARAGEAVAQLVTWRARAAAADRAGALVARGAALTQLLAAVARSECRAANVRLHPETGVIQDLDFPLLGARERRELMAQPTEVPVAFNMHHGPFCITAAGYAGSRLSKVYAILQMLSDDLDFKVSIADETYTMYKNVSLSVADEVMLILCSHYQACKLGEVWAEVEAMLAAGDSDLPAEDARVLEEFLQLYKGWAREIKYQQERTHEIQKNKELMAEASLYAFLSRCRLTTALDGLRDLRRCVRAADPRHLGHVRLHDAVIAHHRRFSASVYLEPIRTYSPPLDSTNVIGQNIKVYSIPRKTLPVLNEDPPSNTCGC